MSNKAIAILADEKYKTQIKTDDHSFIVDEPIDLGGSNLGPNPGELLSAALASCSVITMKMYASRKGWKLDEVLVDVEYERDTKENITKFIKKIVIRGDLDEKKIERLFEIASRCPIHRILENPTHIKSELIK